MHAVLHTWGYVSGSISRPADIKETDKLTADAVQYWIEADLKLQSNIVLLSKGAIKLQSIYYSKGPTRKVALLNHLMSLKIADVENAGVHCRRFFDLIDEFPELDVDINKDVLAVMLLS